MGALRPLPAAFLLTAAFGCEAQSPSHPPRDGTTRMADTLAVLYAQAVANPLSNPFLSRQRADAIQATLARQVGTPALGNRFLLAKTRLMAGQTREAIAEIQRLMHPRSPGTSPSGLSPGTYRWQAPRQRGAGSARGRYRARHLRRRVAAPANVLPVKSGRLS